MHEFGFRDLLAGANVIRAFNTTPTEIPSIDSAMLQVLNEHIYNLDINSIRIDHRIEPIILHPDVKGYSGKMIGYSDIGGYKKSVLVIKNDKYNRSWVIASTLNDSDDNFVTKITKQVPTVIARQIEQSITFQKTSEDKIINYVPENNSYEEIETAKMSSIALQNGVGSGHGRTYASFDTKEILEKSSSTKQEVIADDFQTFQDLSMVGMYVNYEAKVIDPPIKEAGITLKLSTRENGSSQVYSEDVVGLPISIPDWAKANQSVPEFLVNYAFNLSSMQSSLLIGNGLKFMSALGATKTIWTATKIFTNVHEEQVQGSVSMDDTYIKFANPFEYDGHFILKADDTFEIRASSANINWVDKSEMSLQDLNLALSFDVNDVTVKFGQLDLSNVDMDNFMVKNTQPSSRIYV